MGPEILKHIQVAVLRAPIFPVANCETASTQSQFFNSLRIRAEKRPFAHTKLDKHFGFKKIDQEHRKRHVYELGRCSQPQWTGKTDGMFQGIELGHSLNRLASGP